MVPDVNFQQTQYEQNLRVQDESTDWVGSYRPLNEAEDFPWSITADAMENLRRRRAEE